MSKFCFGCGGVSDDEAVFCARCGARFDAPVMPVEKSAPTQTPPVPEAQPAAPVEPPKKTKKSKKKWVIVFAVVFTVALLAAGVLTYFLFFSHPYTKPIELYLDAMFLGKTENVEKLAPRTYWHWCEENSDKTAQQHIEEAEDAAKRSQEQMVKLYGEDLECEYEITDRQELSAKKLRAITKLLDDHYDIDADSVKKGYALEVEISISGDKDEKEMEQEVIVVQIGYTWYWVIYYDSSYVSTVYFPVWQSVSVQ